MGDHREIWLEPKCAEECSEGRTWCSSDAWGKCDDCNQPSVKYIRADIARIAGLKEALEMLKGGANTPEVGHALRARAALITARIAELEKGTE